MFVMIGYDLEKDGDWDRSDLVWNDLIEFLLFWFGLVSIGLHKIWPHSVPWVPDVYVLVYEMTLLRLTLSTSRSRWVAGSKTGSSTSLKIKMLRIYVWGQFSSFDLNFSSHSLVNPPGRSCRHMAIPSWSLACTYLAGEREYIWQEWLFDIFVSILDKEYLPYFYLFRTILTWS